MSINTRQVKQVMIHPHPSEESYVTTKPDGESLCVLANTEKLSRCNVKWTKQHCVCYVATCVIKIQRIHIWIFLYICLKKYFFSGRITKKLLSGDTCLEEDVGNTWMESGIWGIIFIVCLFNLKQFLNHMTTLAIQNLNTYLKSSIKMIHYILVHQHTISTVEAVCPGQGHRRHTVTLFLSPSCFWFQFPKSGCPAVSSVHRGFPFCPMIPPVSFILSSPVNLQISGITSSESPLWWTPSPAYPRPPPAQSSEAQGPLSPWAPFPGGVASPRSGQQPQEGALLTGSRPPQTSTCFSFP